MYQLIVYKTMKPQTVTVPINGCQQLMFWLANTDNWSGKYIFYDIKLAKEVLPLDIHRATRLSQAVITQPTWSEIALEKKWERPQSSSDKNVNKFLVGLSNAYNQVKDLISKNEPKYEIPTYYLETNAGQVCKAIVLQLKKGNNCTSVTRQLTDCTKQLETLMTLRKTLSELSSVQINANLNPTSLGLNAISYGKLIKRGGKVLKECKTITDLMYQEKLGETQFLQTAVDTAVDIDGKQSSEDVVFCPLLPGETPPTDELQLVEHFVVQ